MISFFFGGGPEGGDKIWAVRGDFLGHDFIEFNVVRMYTGCLTLAETVQHNKGDI